ncbi:DUF4998 domain-containing protein [Sphingobacterium sp. xlx-130]|uniref:DUF4998 domain-containing protein n=1 Tax=Sphingobacterium sp. xlx-130 TaxID=2654323 RepID=UPI0013DD20F1|nr:DUF4998 domain-containing protein [Sphingobacterium sp. xlx-130]
MKYYNKLYVMVAIACTLFIACSKMNDPIAEYVKNGEIIYSTRLDSLKVFSGNERVKLTWLLPANHSAVKAVVYWDGKKHSRELPLQKTLVNNYEFTMEAMTEGYYLFSIYTFDKAGNASIKSEISAVVYGERYRKDLLNLVYTKLSKLTQGVSINWAVAEKAMVAVDVEYTDMEGRIKIKRTPTTEKITTIIDADSNKPIRYRTVFNPGLNAIDVFLSDWTGYITVN